MRAQAGRTSADDCSDMRAAQRGGQPARHESVHELHALDVARGRHDLQERAVERQRALVLFEVGGARLGKQLRLLPAGALRIGVIHPINVLHDREAGRPERVGEQKRTCVGPVRRDARGWELVVMIRRKGAPDDCTGRGEVNGELIRDSRVLDVGDAIRREQRREDVAVLTGLGRGERGQRPNRKTEVQADAVEVAGADARARQDE